MKFDTIVSLVTREEVLAYVRGLFRTKEVLASFDDPDGYVRAIVEKFADLPRIFFEMSDPALESSHFTTWFGAMALRHYESDGISDVYYLHEIYHAATMTYEREMPWNRWFTKMGLNELEAALHSEVIIYKMLPGLREKTFPHEIWADRFIANPDYADFKRRREAKEVLGFVNFHYRSLFDERKRVMASPDPYDFLELQIAMYGRQNLHWASIWKNHYNDVEAHMAAFAEIAKTDRVKAIKIHVKWLERNGIVTFQAEDDRSGRKYQERMQTGIPFIQEARAFAEAAAANKAIYGNHLLA